MKDTMDTFLLVFVVGVVLLAVYGFVKSLQDPCHYVSTRYMSPYMLKHCFEELEREGR